MTKCQWCLKRNLPKHPQWEQLKLTTGEWVPMCDTCAQRKLRIANSSFLAAALIEMRRIEEAQHG
jgi:hypothetical protein